MEVNRLDGYIVNAGLCLSQEFKGANRQLARWGRKIGFANDFPDGGQRSSVSMIVFLRLPDSMRVTMLMSVSMFVIVLMRMRMAMFSRIRDCFGANSIDQHFNPGGGDAAAIHTSGAQFGADIQSRNRALQKLKRNAGMDERAQQHVAADSGKALKVGYAHELMKRRPS